jgi:type IV pilus assembly protein PilM
MAKYAGVWGIDIGQAAFKAMRCQLVDGKLVADAFDYIEYPKILSQPEAEPEKMIQEAIQQFLGRNDVKGYKVALAVPGQSGLAKFFKPPPVDAKKIPEIVKYEARQQIPFALEDVIWDFQQMGGEEVEGYAVETEVGLFAMKREQVFRAMKPFRDAGIELDIIQLAPLSIYNFVSHDILGDQLASQEYDPDNPPPSLVVLSMGTDTTDLVITNGFRVWQRSVPLGGNHFTKQLTKELKLTFAKAEHLKRNARQAEDPKMVFQAMRPVFNDLVTEVQRSIGYFQGIDRKAKIGGIVVLGNAVKLPGLQQYLAKNLGYEVNNFETFSHLDGSAVTSSPAFRDNQLSFSVCYGLCLQGLNVARLKTNLVPREIMTDRLIRSKKPWAVASVAVLLLACTFNIFFYWGRLHQAVPERSVAGVPWEDAISRINSVGSRSQEFQNKDQELVAQLNRITAIGEELVGNSDRKILWLEMLKALNEALPVTPGLKPGEIPDVETVPFHQRQEIHVEEIESQYFEDLSSWFSDYLKEEYIKQQRSGPNRQAAPEEDEATGLAASGPTGPDGEGWVIQLKCYHYFNENMQRQGMTHVLNTVVRNLKYGRIVFPVPVGKIRVGNVLRHQAQSGEFYPLHVTAVSPITQPVDGREQLTGYQLQLEGLDEPISVAVGDMVPAVFTMEEMGIDYPVVVADQPIDESHQVPNPNYVPPESGMPGGDGYPGGSGGYPGGMPGGMGTPGGSFGSGGSSIGGNNGAEGEEGEEPEEPQYLTVPRYDFTLQYTWKETLLSDRLEAQAEKWTAKQQSAPAAGGGLAANTSGGA